MGSVRALILWLLIIISSSTSTLFVSANYSLVVGQPATLQLSPSLLVENSPGSKPGSKVACERVQIDGLSRLKHLRKFANSGKVKASLLNSSGRLPNVEVCFHRNSSLGIGICPQNQWEKLTKGSWARSMSPFDHKLLDIRMLGSSSETLEVSLDEEFFLHRVIFLVVGVVLLTLASSLSKSLVFYYGSAMALGVVLVVLMILFQGMRLLPTGRKSSLAIVLYSSIVGLGSFLLRFVPGLLQSILVEIGIHEEMHNPLITFLLVVLVLAGAWLGFWVVHKLVLTQDGSINTHVSHFVAWSIRIFASILILQSSLDPLLAAEALVCGILVSSILRKLTRRKFLRNIYKKIRSQNYSSPVLDFYGSRRMTKAPFSTPTRGSTRMSPRRLSDSDAFYSTFHDTPERRKFSDDEWEKFTRQSTKNALEGLVSSPDFNRWAVAHAERITLAPKKETADRKQRGKWLPWL